MDILMNRLSEPRIIASLFFAVLLLLSANSNWIKIKTTVFIGEIMDCFFPIWSYILVVLTHYNAITDYSDKMFLYFYVVFEIIFIVSQFASFVEQLVLYSKASDRILQKYPLATIITNLFVMLLMQLSTLNYIIYVLFPHQYQLPKDLSFGAIGFEFVYYTFSLLITYGATSIEAIGIITKSLQIFEIVICYICVGIGLMNLIDKLKSKWIKYK